MKYVHSVLLSNITKWAKTRLCGFQPLKKVPGLEFGGTYWPVWGTAVCPGDQLTTDGQADRQIASQPLRRLHLEARHEVQGTAALFLAPLFAEIPGARMRQRKSKVRSLTHEFSPNLPEGWPETRNTFHIIHHNEMTVALWNKSHVSPTQWVLPNLVSTKVRHLSPIFVNPPSFSVPSGGTRTRSARPLCPSYLTPRHKYLCKEPDLHNSGWNGSCERRLHKTI